MKTVYTSRVLVFLGWFTVIAGGAITGGGAVSALVIMGNSWYVWMGVGIWVVFWVYLTALIWSLVAVLHIVLNRQAVRYGVEDEALLSL
jgi:hypothetical protein